MPLPSTATGPLAFGGVIPVLRVGDVEVSRAYYVQSLGFRVNFQVEDFLSISRGSCSLFLSAGDQGKFGSWVWIDAVDVDAVYEEYKLSGAHIRHPPTNYPWAREMQVQDPDGNILRLGSDPQPGEPVGEWLDMYGQRWLDRRKVDYGP